MTVPSYLPLRFLPLWPYTLALSSILLTSLKISIKGTWYRNLKPCMMFWQGDVICPYYLKTGTCKFGATCKFDHPPPGEVMEMAKSQGTSANGEEAEGDTSALEQLWDLSWKLDSVFDEPIYFFLICFFWSWYQQLWLKTCFV